MRLLLFRARHVQLSVLFWLVTFLLLSVAHSREEAASGQEDGEMNNHSNDYYNEIIKIMQHYYEFV